MGIRYRANEPRYVDETVDGEALIMDMVRGNYYSCAGISAIAWNALKSGADATEVVDLLVATYGISKARAEEDLEAFVAALLVDEVLVAVPDAETSTPSTLEPLGAEPTYDGLRFERYSDLADLILLDPVHDVTDAGWPHTTA